MGQRLRLARVRRRMPAAELAQRAGVSRMTIYKLEHGDLSVGLGVLVRVLGVLGLDGDIDLIARDDELGRRLQDAMMPRPRRSIR
jgi:transcriptional regulator with XRE-family HTH domain